VQGVFKGITTNSATPAVVHILCSNCDLKFDVLTAMPL
jgi:hypothetical protein